MDYPFLIGFVVLIVIWMVGASVEKFRSWAKPAAVLGTAAVMVELLVLFFR